MSTIQENPYLRDAVMTATPEQLQLMLYDGAIRYCNQARDALGRKDFETSFEKLTRAQNIMLEMQNGLRYDINEELCRRVSSVYTFIYRKLLNANIHRNTQDIDDALRVLQVERETWQILIEKVNRIREGENEESMAAGTAGSRRALPGGSSEKSTFSASG